MTRRLTPVKLLPAAVLIIGEATVGVHEVSIRSASCHGVMGPVPQCAVA